MACGEFAVLVREFKVELDVSDLLGMKHGATHVALDATEVPRKPHPIFYLFHRSGLLVGLFQVALHGRQVSLVVVVAGVAKLAHEGRVQVSLLDVRFLDANGIQLFATIRTTNLAILFIFVCNYFK